MAIMAARFLLLATLTAALTTDAPLPRLRRAPTRHRPALATANLPKLDTTADLQAAVPPSPPGIFPCGDALDQRICKLAIPALLNFLILPVTGTIDLLYIGRLGSALATAGQAAANQVYTTAGLLTSVIPVVTVPLVAKAHAAGDREEVQRQVGGAIFLSIMLGAVVSLLVGLGSRRWLLAVGSAAALPYSLPYLTCRLPGREPPCL